MTYQHANPSNLLKPYVKQYWGLTNCTGTGENQTHRVIPSGMPELILYIGQKPTSDQRNIEDHCMVSGQQNSFYDLRLTHSPSVFAVTFHPQGICQFFGLPMSELMNRTIPLRYLNDSLHREFELRLTEAESFAMRVHTAEELLLALLTKHHQRTEFARINQVVETIRNYGGTIGVEQLADISCLSIKQFERRFLEQIGLSPKQYLRVVRFQAAIHRKSQEPNLLISHLAYDCGYYDQSHLCNEFKSLSGLTPGQFFADCDAVSDLFG